MPKNAKTIFTCQSCGYRSAKWMGRCPECGGWDSLVAETVDRPARYRSARGKRGERNAPVPIDQVEGDAESRTNTGIGEFDRVLGGGLVPGSLVLIGGDPGIGKSTLMLQALNALAADGRRVLYVSGEESVRQLKLRGRRLEATSANLLVTSEIDVDAVLEMVSDVQPEVVVIDSIQTMYAGEISSAPGSVSQVRECAMRCMLLAKQSDVPVLLVGHVTKDGSLAGPRLLEHMVDTVLYFEGDRNHVFRLLRAVKNRFGSTNEIGVFHMQACGLVEVPNPSSLFLAERLAAAPGSVVTASMEGSRPILVELQALVSSSSLGTPRRTVLGIDSQRVALLVAVLEKKLGMHLPGHDVFLNVAGGVRIDEPAVDLAIVAAVASSFLDRPVAEGTLVLGEVGLAGEVRAVGQIEQRVGEAAKMGFTRCLAPRGNVDRVAHPPAALTLTGVRTLAEALEQLF